MRVSVIDYGTGNLGSMLRALEELDASPSLASRPDMLGGANRIVLPGVGGFTDCMTLLHEGGWVDAIHEVALEGKTALLGVCVGMQLLVDLGEEGATGGDGTPGLGLIGGRVRHLKTPGCNSRLSHVGWNAVHLPATRDPLFSGVPDGTHFYFVHSYAVLADDPAVVIASASHSVAFSAAIRKGTIWGTQFHPEKSSRAGFRVLRNFLGQTQC
jgi:glutamine amidotransferase